MSQLSRRSLVSSAVALPALAVPGVAIADNPDAELVRLGEQFEGYQSSYKALLADYNEKADAANRLAFERMDAADLPQSAPERNIRFAAEMDRAWTETGATEADRKFSAVGVPHDSIREKIMETPCHTVAGLRAKALVAIDQYDALWREQKDDLDWNKRVIRELIEGVCAVAGLQIPAERAYEDESEEAA